METQKITVNDIRGLKGKRRVTMLTAYDYSTAFLVDKAGIDMILVGDSLANVMLGLESTTQVGMKEMIHHGKAVVRGVKHAMVVMDMPYEACVVEPQESIACARRLVEETGSPAVKIEWSDRCLEIVEGTVKAGIPVVGHIGLTPQTADKLGGFKVQGKDAERAAELIRQAQSMEKAGCFALVLECVPDKIAGMITRAISIPTIGIGAGPECDGQVLVIHDCLGLFERYTPKFVKKYADLSPIIVKALEEYKNEVISGAFPDKAHSFGIKEEELEKLKSQEIPKP